MNESCVLWGNCIMLNRMLNYPESRKASQKKNSIIIFTWKNKIQHKTILFYLINNKNWSLNSILFNSLFYYSVTPDPVYFTDRRSMKIGVPAWWESQMFWQQVGIELSAVRTCSVAPCIIFAINSFVLLLFRERHVREWMCAEFSKIGNSLTPGRNNIILINRTIPMLICVNNYIHIFICISYISQIG